MNSSNILTAIGKLGAVIAILLIIGLILESPTKLPISQPIPKSETSISPTKFDWNSEFALTYPKMSPEEIEASVERKNAELKLLGDYCRSKDGIFEYAFSDEGFPGYYGYMLINRCRVLGKDDVVRVYRVEDYNGSLKLTERNT